MDTYTDEFPRLSFNHALYGKLMLCAVVVLFLALLILLCFYNCALVFLRYHRRRYLRRRAQHLLSVSVSANSTAADSKGLDPSVIETIPTFIHSAKASHFSSLECAVCLSEFENGDKARVLPKCNHAFHVDCIDIWLNSNSNCPLCRAPVQADISINPPKTFEHAVVPMAEPDGSEPRGEDHIEMNSSSAAGSSSSSSPSSSSSASLLKLESCPMKTLEVVGLEILVEVPRVEDRLRSVAADEGSGSRTRSLKRFWSL